VPSPTSPRLPKVAYPILNRLTRGDEELSALARQGFLRREQRGKKTIFRLRFRLHGRQYVRYVSREDAEALEAELEVLQSLVRARRRLARLAALTRQALRHRKLALAPLLDERGLRFHGHHIRGRRATKQC
jgi:hypothetical protein